MAERTFVPVRVRQDPGPLSARDAVGAAASAAVVTTADSSWFPNWRSTVFRRP